MDDKEEENDKNSQNQLQQSQVEESKEAEENVEVEASREPSVTNVPSDHPAVVTSPSVAKSKSVSEKSRANISSSAKVSIKAAEEGEQDTGKGLEPLAKESTIPTSQTSALRAKASAIISAIKDSKIMAGSISNSKGLVVAERTGDGGGGPGRIAQGENFLGVGSLPCSTGLLNKRSPFIHDPPFPEERRARVQPPRSPIDYIINLREDLADFQESHGLPRTRDYSFVSLGLALAQETGRAILSVFQMFTELFPILAIVSLILRFALDKLIEILETTDTVAKIKKSIIFALEMLAIMIPLWILFGTIIIPLITLILSLFKRVLRIKGGKKKIAKPSPKPVTQKPKVVKTSCSIR